MKSIARDLALAIVAVALFGGVTLAGPRDGKKKTEEDGPKTIVIQLDVSKLPGDLLAQLLKAAGGRGASKPIKKPGDDKPGDKKPQPGDKKPDTKPTKQIGLIEAIASAEKFTQGTAYKAEYENDGFGVMVKTGKGATKVKIDFAGNVVGDKGGKKGEEFRKPGQQENNQPGNTDNNRSEKKPGKKGRKK